MGPYYYLINKSTNDKAYFLGKCGEFEYYFDDIIKSQGWNEQDCIVICNDAHVDSSLIWKKYWKKYYCDKCDESSYKNIETNQIICDWCEEDDKERAKETNGVEEEKNIDEAEVEKTNIEEDEEEEEEEECDEEEEEEEEELKKVSRSEYLIVKGLDQELKEYMATRSVSNKHVETYDDDDYYNQYDDYYDYERTEYFRDFMRGQ